MKLVIECTEQTYSECKKISGLSVTASVIANGIPYNPSGDCISREALKEYVKKVEDNESANTICAYIDSAPTVEPDMEFAKWVTKMIFDNQIKDFDFELFSELACRKLEKMGLVEKTESEWICPNCYLYEQAEDDYCQYAGEGTIGCHKCKYFKQKGGKEE